jgi:hypothetical protein
LGRRNPQKNQSCERDWDNQRDASLVFASARSKISRPRRLTSSSRSFNNAVGTATSRRHAGHTSAKSSISELQNGQTTKYSV